MATQDHSSLAENDLGPGSPTEVRSGEVSVSLGAMIREIASAVQLPVSLGSLFERIAAYFLEVLKSLEPGAHGSIWLTDFLPTTEDPDSPMSPVLDCKHIFGEGAHWPKNPRRVFGRGLIGWVGQNREMLNVVVTDPTVTLPDGRAVGEIYIPWKDMDTTGAELVLPMVYQGRLVGVLDLERPTPAIFPPDLVLTAQFLALHAAQAIHHQQIDQLYTKILDEGELEQLARAVVHVAGIFIEARFSRIYVWNTLTQSLRLTATSFPVLDADEKPVTPDRDCYPAPGIGITRWVFDHKMWLSFRDLDAYAEPEHPDHATQKREILDQVLRQRLAVEDVGRASVEETIGPPDEAAAGLSNDERRFWRIRVPGREPWTILQPIWSKEYRFHYGQSRSLVLVPIVDTRGAKSVLGVMNFSRLDARAFGESDVALLQSLARHLAPAIWRSQLVQAQALERRLVSQVVTMEPTYWKEDFHHRLQQHLKAVRELLEVDLVLVRMKDHRGELQYVASDPTEAVLQDAWQAPKVRIPKVTYVGIGGTGRAAETGQPVFCPNGEDQLLKEAREAIPPDSEGETTFASKVRSEIAVPLMAGEAVVGTLTAISSKPSSQAAQLCEGRWSCSPTGVQEHHLHLLQNQALWLGPALETIQVMVQRSRQLSSLSTAIKKLTEIINDRSADPKRFNTAALVIATHHDGLGFHQAFIAECAVDNSLYQGWINLTGKFENAWGCQVFSEQDIAHREQGDLEADVNGALRDPGLCAPIRKAWSTFNVHVPHLLETPCLIVRQGSAEELPPGPRLVNQQVAVPGDPWWKLLDAFCELFSIDPLSAPARTIEVGMVKLGRRPSGPPKAVMFVTNVGFPSAHASPYFDPIRRESLAAFQALGSLLVLAGAVGNRDRLRKEVYKMRRKLTKWFFEGKNDAG
jgi:GAF domain-containing protein